MNWLSNSPVFLASSLVVSAAMADDVSKGGTDPRGDAGADVAIEIRVDDNEPIRAVQSGTPFGDGSLRYTGEKASESGDWLVSWNYTADLDPNGHAGITGTAQIVNRSGEMHAFDVRLSFPIDPLIDDQCKIGGQMTVSLTMDEDGGRLSVPYGHAGWSMVLDGESQHRVHTGPFAMQGSGSGTAVTQASFGAPFPGQNGPAVEDSFGVRHDFRLTPGDTVSYFTNIVLGGDPEDFRRRRNTSVPIRLGGGDGKIVVDLSGNGTSRGRGRIRNAPTKSKGGITVRMDEPRKKKTGSKTNRGR